MGLGDRCAGDKFLQLQIPTTEEDKLPHLATLDHGYPHLSLTVPGQRENVHQNISLPYKQSTQSPMMDEDFLCLFLTGLSWL